MRLLDQNLPRLTREIARGCWHATDGIVPQMLDNTLYRALYRSVRGVFRRHVTAFRFCNAASVCERSIPRAVLALQPRQEQFSGEHVHVFLMDGEAAPERIVREIVQNTVKAVVCALPRQPLRGLAEAHRHAIRKALGHRIFPSERCGDDALCHANEAYDPWDLTDPINRIRPAV